MGLLIAELREAIAYAKGIGLGAVRVASNVLMRWQVISENSRCFRFSILVAICACDQYH